MMRGEGTSIAHLEGTSVALTLWMSHSRNKLHSADETKATFHFTIERDIVVQSIPNDEGISTILEHAYARLPDKEFNVEFFPLLDPETSPSEIHTLLRDLEIPPSCIEGLKRDIALIAYQDIMEIPSKECEDGYSGTFDFFVSLVVYQVYCIHPGEEEEEEEEEEDHEDFEALVMDGLEEEGFRWKPASRSSIEALERKKFDGGDSSSTEICMICMDEYMTGVDVTQLPCSHLFHSECIIMWLENKNTCPLCRSEMPIEA